jgi:hypothetical protein
MLANVPKISAMMIRPRHVFGFLVSFGRAVHDCNVRNNVYVLEMRTLTIDQWAQKARPFFLTKAAIESLKVGKTLDLLVLHRNVLDTKVPHVHPVTAAKYFFADRLRFTSLGKLKGVITWPGDPTHHVIELHAELKPGLWYPARSHHKDQSFQQLFGDQKPGLHSHTLVGIRGPMMLWTNVKKMDARYRIIG